MAHYIATNTIEALAASVGATVAVVKTFIQTHRANGNIGAVLTYIEDNPGATEVEIETATAIAAQVVANILKLLEFTGHIEQF
jgi:hypothetical protein